MKKIIIALGIFLLPAVQMVSAQTSGQVTTLKLNNSIQNLIGTVNLIEVLLIAAAIVFFIVGVIRFIFLAKSPEKVKEARSFLIYSIVGLAIILSIFGITKLLISFFGISDNTVDNTYLPTVQQNLYNPVIK